jgi:hypothetical protein
VGDAFDYQHEPDFKAGDLRLRAAPKPVRQRFRSVPVEYEGIYFDGSDNAMLAIVNLARKWNREVTLPTNSIIKLRIEPIPAWGHEVVELTKGSWLLYRPITNMGQDSMEMVGVGEGGMDRFYERIV